MLLVEGSTWDARGFLFLIICCLFSWRRRCRDHPFRHCHRRRGFVFLFLFLCSFKFQPSQCFPLFMCVSVFDPAAVDASAAGSVFI